jgi:hypothetical protein
MTTLELNNDLDQLAAEARGLNGRAEALIALAWWFTERDVRDATGACSLAVDGHAPGIDRRCQCCRHFAELRGRAAFMEARL